MANFWIFIVTNAQNAEVTEQQKFAYLNELLNHDIRQCLANALDLARFSKLDFESTGDLLITSHSNQPAGSIRMAAMGSVSYCFDFQKGECIQKNCMCFHKLMSDQVKSDTNFIIKQEQENLKRKKWRKKEKVNSRKNNNNTGTNGMHNTNKTTSLRDKFSM